MEMSSLATCRHEALYDFFDKPDISRKLATRQHTSRASPSMLAACDLYIYLNGVYINAARILKFEENENFYNDCQFNYNFSI
jgi:hypothetical protein